MYQNFYPFLLLQHIGETGGAGVQEGEAEWPLSPLPGAVHVASYPQYRGNRTEEHRAWSTRHNTFLLQ